jgi:hypothetical protein
LDIGRIAIIVYRIQAESGSDPRWLDLSSPPSIPSLTIGTGADFGFLSGAGVGIIGIEASLRQPETDLFVHNNYLSFCARLLLWFKL